jgi:hypothetical protein
VMPAIKQAGFSQFIATKMVLAPSRATVFVNRRSLSGVLWRSRGTQGDEFCRSLGRYFSRVHSRGLPRSSLYVSEIARCTGLETNQDNCRQVFRVRWEHPSIPYTGYLFISRSQLAKITILSRQECSLSSLALMFLACLISPRSVPSIQ